MDSMKKPKNLIINGAGSSNGGHFDKVEINGKGKLNGDVKCQTFECNGTGSVNGNLAAGVAKVNGTSKLNGEVKCELLHVKGRSSIKEKAIINQLKVEGKATLDESLKSEEVHIKGKLAVQGDCEAEIFRSEGIFEINGLLNADKINVTLYGECIAKEIGAHTVHIKRKGSIFNLFKSFFPNNLTTDLIEGDEIDIVHTTAKTVRGHNVKIGPDCQIDLVEYTGEYTCDKGSVVKEYKKV